MISFSVSLPDRSEEKVQHLLWSILSSLVHSLFFPLPGHRCIFSSGWVAVENVPCTGMLLGKKIPLLHVIKLRHTANPHERDASLGNILDPPKCNPHLPPGEAVVAFCEAYSHQKHFLRSFLTRDLVLGRPEEEGAGVGLVSVAAGTSYSPSRASITPWKRPSCCRKSCSTL